MKYLFRIMTVAFALLGARICVISQNSWSTPVLIDSSTIYPTIYRGGVMALDDSDNIYTAFSSSRSENIFVARSTNGGNQWVKHGYIDGAESLRTPMSIALDHLGNVWLLWISTNGGDLDPYYVNLSKSSDSGKSFTTLFRSVAWGNGFWQEQLVVDGQNNIYMLWDDQQFKLTRFQQGDISQRIDNEILNGTMAFGYNTCLMVTKDFAVHCLWEGVYTDSTNELHEHVYYSRSNDTGRNFQSNVRVDTTASAVYYDADHDPSLAVDSSGVVYVSYTKQTVVNDQQIRVARSTDHGQSFHSPVTISGNDTAYESKTCVDSRQGINILWGAKGIGIRHYRSTDGGVSFSSFATFAHIGSSSFIAGANGYLFAAGSNDSGFGFAKTDVILSIRERSIQPLAFQLMANYPNPFNPTTTIKFIIGKTEDVSLSVYDVNGREIASLVNRRLIPGTYSVQWNGAGRSSGVYYARLMAGKDFRQTQRMILLK